MSVDGKTTKLVEQLVQRKSFGNLVQQHKSSGKEVMLSDAVWEEVKELVRDMEKATDRVEDENWWMLSFACAVFAAQLINFYAEDKKEWHINFCVETLEDFSRL